MKDEGNSDSKVASSLISGGIAGIFVETILYPLDAMKTKKLYKLLSRHHLVFNKKGRCLDVYSGIKYSALSSFVSSSIFFSSFHILSNCTPEAKYKTLKTTYISLMSEILASLFRVPFEVIKQNIQVGNKSLSKCLRSNRLMFKKSFNPNEVFVSLIRDIPFSVIQFSIWEKLNRLGDETFVQGSKYRHLSSGIFGGLGGGVAAFITSPADNIRTYIFTNHVKSNISNESIPNIIKKMYRLGGTKAFYYGSFLRTLWLTLGGILYFGCYQFSYDIVEKASLGLKHHQYQLKHTVLPLT